MTNSTDSSDSGKTIANLNVKATYSELVQTALNQINLLPDVESATLEDSLKQTNAATAYKIAMASGSLTEDEIAALEEAYRTKLRPVTIKLATLEGYTAWVEESKVSYDTLQGALDAEADDAHILLLKDTTENVVITKPVTLDLGGFTLSAAKEDSVIRINSKSTRRFNEDDTLIIKNGTVTGGKAINGGGINIINNSGDSSPNIILDGLVIEKNKATNGAAMSILLGKAVIQNCTFRDNEADNSGGAILVSTGGKASVTCSIADTVIENNSAKIGGAIGMGAANYATLSTTATVMLEDGTLISENKALLDWYQYGGGGVYLTGNGSRFIMNGGIITKNTVGTGDSGYGCGGGIFSANWTGVTLNGGVISDNSAVYGGGIYIYNPRPEGQKNNGLEMKLSIGDDMQVIGNTASDKGGGLYIESDVIATVASSAEVYNNNATIGSDDIYASPGSKLTIYPVVSGLTLNDCGHEIDGWYYDAWGDGYRWNAHPSEGDADLGFSTYKYDIGEAGACFENGAAYLKAAHGKMPSVSGVVFNDTNRDNIYTSGTDSVLSNVALTLWKQETAADGSTNSWVDTGMTAATDANGAYSFGNLESGEYQIRISSTPSGVNRDCSVVADNEQGNKFSGNTATVTISTTDVVANAGYYYRRSSGGSDTTPTPSPSNPSGDGGSGTDIPDTDTPLASLEDLNTDDHYQYIQGYEDGTVQPEGNITREEVATIFYRLLTDEARATYSAYAGSESFSDVADSRWSAKAIKTLAAANVLTGYEDGTFRPGAYITRAEFATVASKFNLLADDGSVVFTDVPDDYWAKEYIYSATTNNWITGYEDGTFKPTNYIKRDESATIINRVLNRRVNAEGLGALSETINKFSDLQDTSAWYYYQMVEATNYHDYDRTVYDRTDASMYEIWTELHPNKDYNEN